LGIRHVGEETARDLARQAYTLEDIKNMTYADIRKIPGFGPETAQSIVNFFYNEWDRIEALSKCLHIENVRSTDVEQTLARSVFVVTGSFEGRSRDEIKAHIEERGGSVSSSVSKKTSFVIAGNDPSPGKLKKAVELGIMIIDFIPDRIDNF
jgi:DNA ligase (NAD+)